MFCLSIFLGRASPDRAGARSYRITSLCPCEADRTLTFEHASTVELRLFIKIGQPDFKFLSIKSDFGQRDWKAKPTRTDAAGVNVDNTMPSINAGLMGVP